MVSQYLILHDLSDWFSDNHHKQPLYNFHGFVKNILLTRPYKLCMREILHYIVKTVKVHY